MASFKTILAAALLFTAPAFAAEKAPAAKSAEKPIVWVFSTGGTISGAGSSPTDMSNYKSGKLTGADLVKGLPQLADVADVHVEQVTNTSSNDMTIETWLTLARRINETFADPKVAGVVVTHGTSTMEETAYFLNLTVKSNNPVVMVGAMRPSTAISADGPLNLLNAVRVAASPDAKGKGAMIVLNDEINSARDATKTNTYRVETFRAPELGLLGYVDEDKVAFYRAPAKRHTAASEFDVKALKTLPAVDIVYSYVQPSTVMLEALVKAGDKGIVFAGTGAGGLSKFEKDAFKTIAAAPGPKPVIVRASRTGNGRVIGTKDYDEVDMLPADTLNPQKARILLMLALTKTSDPKEIRRIFSEY
jgi:L-asparaginase type II